MSANSMAINLDEDLLYVDNGFFGRKPDSRSDAQSLRRAVAYRCRWTLVLVMSGLGGMEFERTGNSTA